MSSRVVFFLAASVLAGAAWSLTHQARPASDIVSEFRSVKSPGFSLDPNVTPEESKRRIDSALTRQCALALEMLRSHPDHPETPKLVNVRWLNQINGLGGAAQALSEARAVVSAQRPERLVPRARMAVAQATLALDDADLATKERAVEEAIAANPKDATSAGYLWSELATKHTADPARQRAWLDRAHAPSSFTKLLARLGQRIEIPIAEPRSTLVFVTALERPEEHGDLKRLSELRPALDAKGIGVLAINAWLGSESTADSLRAKARDLGWSAPLFIDPAPLEEGWAWRLGLHGTPLFLLLDAEGRLVAACERLKPLAERLGIERPH